MLENASSLTTVALLIEIYYLHFLSCNRKIQQPVAMVKLMNQ